MPWVSRSISVNLSCLTYEMGYDSRTPIHRLCFQGLEECLTYHFPLLPLQVPDLTPLKCFQPLIP